VEPLVAALGEALELVPLQRDERRDDDRRAVDEEPGELVDGGLARARGHDDEEVLTPEQRADGVELPRPQLAPAEAVAGGPAHGRGGEQSAAHRGILAQPGPVEPVESVPVRRTGDAGR
jgi:hypothetical protein